MTQKMKTEILLDQHNASCRGTFQPPVFPDSPLWICDVCSFAIARASTIQPTPTPRIDFDRVNFNNGFVVLLTRPKLGAVRKEWDAFARLLAEAPAMEDAFRRWIVDCDTRKQRGGVLTTQEGQFLDEAKVLLARIDGRELH